MLYLVMVIVIALGRLYTDLHVPIEPGVDLSGVVVGIGRHEPRFVIDDFIGHDY